MTGVTNPPPVKDHFAQLLAAQKLVLDRFSDTGFKIPAVLSIVLGWLVSSQTAQQFLQKSPLPLWIVLLLVTVVVTVAISWMLIRTRAASNRLHLKLQQLEYGDEDYFKYYRVSNHMFWGVLALNGLLCTLLVAGVVYIRFRSW